MHSRSIAIAVLLTWATAAAGQASQWEHAEADAAMERAQRAAAGPLKAILQAAKVRRRGEADAPLSPAAAPPALLALESMPAALDLTEVAALAAANPVAEEVSLPVLVSASAMPEVPPVAPKALSMPEPAIPPSLLVQEVSVTEVEADLSLRADGSVDGVRVLPTSPRAWQHYITTALEQWRFEPMSGPTVHRVRLVLNAAAR